MEALDTYVTARTAPQREHAAGPARKRHFAGGLVDVDDEPLFLVREVDELAVQGEGAVLELLVSHYRLGRGGGRRSEALGRGESDQER